MKKLAAFFVMASLAGLTGCHNNQSGTGGTPKGGPTGPGKGTPAPVGSFAIQGPSTVDLAQGEEKGVELSLKRDHYAGDVDVKAVTAVGPAGVDKKDVPAFVQVELKNKVFKGEDPKEKLQLTIRADEKAKVGDYGIRVTGGPAKAGDKPTATPLEITVHVKEKKK